MLHTVALWIMIIACLLIDLLIASFVLFGGKVTVTLYGPLRFLSSPKDGASDVPKA